MDPESSPQVIALFRSTLPGIPDHRRHMKQADACRRRFDPCAIYTAHPLRAASAELVVSAAKSGIVLSLYHSKTSKV